MDWERLHPVTEAHLSAIADKVVEKLIVAKAAPERQGVKINGARLADLTLRDVVCGPG